MTTTTTYSWSRARISLAQLPAAQLLADLQGLVAQDRQVTAAVLAHLAEVDARKLYLEAACSSLHGYCVTRLHYSEPAAYKRVHAARAARAFPVIFELVARGELHLAAVTLLAPHLTAANHTELLAAARHQSKRAVIGQALTLLVGELKRRRFAATSRPRTSAADVEGGHTPHLPAAVKRAVAARDGYQCTFVDAAGQRCPARARLEFHHWDPRGRGGGHTVDAVTLRCPGHHALATARDYGAAHVARAVAARRARRQLAPGAAGGGGAGRGRSATEAERRGQGTLLPGASGGALAPLPAPG